MSGWVRAGRTDSRAERVADAAVVAGSLVLGLVGVGVLLATRLPGADVRTALALVVYAAGLLATLTCSALYNLNVAPAWRALFRRLDRAAIFVMIAGTYTPFSLVVIGDPWGWVLFGTVWLGAACGMAVTLALPLRFERGATIAYLALGWVVLLAIEPLVRALSLAGLLLLIGGGVLYSTGVVFHSWRRLPGQNAIWHGFVLAAAACHYAAVLIEVA